MGKDRFLFSLATSVLSYDFAVAHDNCTERPLPIALGFNGLRYRHFHVLLIRFHGHILPQQLMRPLFAYSRELENGLHQGWTLVHTLETLEF